jgi:hypothetical protein
MISARRLARNQLEKIRRAEARVSTIKSPEEKGRLSLALDRRNTYGENSKSSPERAFTAVSNAAIWTSEELRKAELPGQD